MKLDARQLGRALDAVDPAYRLFLLHGPDEAGSRALAQRLASAMGDAERIDLAAGALKADPARLADEAASLSLFGDRRWIRIDPAGEEIAEAAAALLAAATAGNPVVAIAGALRRDSKLLKLATAAPGVAAFASYVPEGDAADRLAIEAARAHGLRVRPDVAHRLAAASGGDRAILARELEKFALYLDAAPERPRDLDLDAVEALGAEHDEGGLDALVNAVLGGDARAADDELARLAGGDGVQTVRALQRRLLLLAELRAEVERGNAVAAVMASAGKSLFWKDKDFIASQLQRWTAARLEAAIVRVGEVGRALMRGDGGGAVMADEALLRLARGAERAR